MTGRLGRGDRQPGRTLCNSATTTPSRRPNHRRLWFQRIEYFEAEFATGIPNLIVTAPATKAMMPITNNRPNIRYPLVNTGGRFPKSSAKVF
jgi:hypothetical protein